MPGLKKFKSKLSLGKAVGPEDGNNVAPSQIFQRVNPRSSRLSTGMKAISEDNEPSLNLRRESSILSSEDAVQKSQVSLPSLHNIDQSSMDQASSIAASVLGATVENKAQEKTFASKIVRRIRPTKLTAKSTRHRVPVDNFNKWDKESNYWDRPCIVSAGISPRINGDVDPVIAAQFEQFKRAVRQKLYDDEQEEGDEDKDSEDEGDDADSVAGVPAQASKLSDIDWSKFETDEQVEEFLASFSLQAPSDHPNNTPSPVDSALGLYPEDVPLMGKGKGRAIELEREVRLPRRRTLSAQSEGPESTMERPHDDIEANSSDLDALLAKDLALQAEIKHASEKMRRLQMEWDDRITALNLEKEQILERQRQEEEDRIKAKQLEEEEELQRVEEELERMRLEEELERLRVEEELERQRIEAEEAARLARLRDCVVCGDTKDKDEFPLFVPSLACTHDIQTCVECVQSWIASQFDSKGVEDLKCPDCPSVLTYEDVKRGASEETFAAYEKMLTRNALSSLPEFSWCLGAGCDNGQLNAENENFMDCASCGYKQCLVHKVPWHTGETCEQYDYRTSGQKAKDEEAATEAMLDSMSKKCPGPGCGWRIQKLDGCDHMTCKRCRYEFCWECLCSHKEIKRIGNTAHKEWCKFHSDNLNVSWPFNVHA